MAILDRTLLPANYKEFSGLSTDDPKPTEGVAVNSLFLELDTGDVYYWDGEMWNKVGGADVR